MCVCARARMAPPSGFKVLEAFNRCCKIVSGGYVGVRDVRSATPPKDDTQQTFWLAETAQILKSTLHSDFCRICRVLTFQIFVFFLCQLKYLYLLFSEDELIPLDKYVFNTEAHPLKVWKEANDI